MTTGACPGRSSSGRKPRPATGGRPRRFQRPADAPSAVTRSGSPSPERFAVRSLNAATDEKLRDRSCQLTKLGTETANSGSPRDWFASQMQTTLSGSVYGSGFSRTACTTLKMTVTAPIPSASVSTVASVKARLLRSTSDRQPTWRSRAAISRCLAGSGRQGVDEHGQPQTGDAGAPLARRSS